MSDATAQAVKDADMRLRAQFKVGGEMPTASGMSAAVSALVHALVADALASVPVEAAREGADT